MDIKKKGGSLKAIFYSLVVIAVTVLQVLYVRKIVGSWQMPIFWCVVVMPFLFGLIGIFVVDPELIAERIRPGGKDKDPFARIIIGILFVAQYIIAALD